jgi:hypothetical protein
MYISAEAKLMQSLARGETIFPWVMFLALRFRGPRRSVVFMMQRRFSGSTSCILFGVLTMLAAGLAVPIRAGAEPPAAAAAGFDSYIGQVEARLTRQRRSPETFLDRTADDARLRRGELVIEHVPADATLPGAMLHHWRGTAFAPGATAADFERLLRDFDAYPRHFSPQVERAAVLGRTGDRIEARMRVRQKHVISVVLDATYDVEFGRLDARHGYVASRSTKISEIDSPGTRSERALSSAEEHGFLWRLNTYWSYEERGGGLFMQIESVSLTRSIPQGLAWAVGPFVESVPRESLEFTLRSVCNALRK